MVKVIVADRKHDCQHLLGQFVDESHYDFLIEEDCDVYMPPKFGEDPISEDRIVLKFRKNYFSKEQQEQAYAGLREAATETQNRGLAAGPRGEKLGNREWVTEYEYDIVDYFLKPTENLFGEDPIDEIRKKYAGKKPEISNRARVWSIDRVKKENFKFDEWVERARKLPADQAKQEAVHVAEDLICLTTYANSVHSGIAGWFDRYPRIPYGRATSYTAKYPEKFAMAYPFLQSLAGGFKEFLPKASSKQNVLYNSRLAICAACIRSLACFNFSSLPSILTNSVCSLSRVNPAANLCNCMLTITRPFGSRDFNWLCENQCRRS